MRELKKSKMLPPNREVNPGTPDTSDFQVLHATP